MIDHAPTVNGTPAKGLRTKSAIRRQKRRQALHAGAERRARRDRNKAQHARQDRREQGWWPPEPLPKGQPPMYVQPPPRSERR